MSRLTLLASLSLLSLPAIGAGAPDLNLAMTFASLALVIGIIFALAWVLKKMQLPTMSGSKELSIVKQIPVGTKERIAVVRAGDAQFLVGITPQSINLISRLEQPIGQSKSEEQDEPSKFAHQFSQLLKRHDKK